MSKTIKLNEEQLTRIVEDAINMIFEKKDIVKKLTFRGVSRDYEFQPGTTREQAEQRKQEDRMKEWERYQKREKERMEDEANQKPSYQERLKNRREVERAKLMHNIGKHWREVLSSELPFEY